MGGLALNRVAVWLSLASVCCGRRQQKHAGVRTNDVGSQSGHALTVMLLSGLAGAYLGLTSEWQIAVESAQVLAGTVDYPVDNPFFMYHVKSWTLLHQLPAVLLACGASERTLSLLLAALTGALSFQAIALCTFAFSRDRLLACVVPLACYVTNACRDLESVHQLRLLSREHWSIYGVFGTAYVLYAWSLAGVGFYRAGALLIGLAPAVHPVLGAWCLGIGGFALALRWHREPALARREWQPLAAGLLLTAVSQAVHLYLARGLPVVDAALANRLVAAFAQSWDNHRVAVPWTHPVMIAAACSTAASAIWLRYGAATLAPPTIVLLRCLAISSPLGLLLSLLTQWQDQLPLPLVMAMPGRFNDLVAVAFPAIVLGLLARQRGNLLLHAMFSLLLVYLALKADMMATHRYYVPSTIKVLPPVCLALLLASNALTGGAAEGRGQRTFWLLVRIAAAASLGAAAYAWRRDERLAWTIVAFTVALWTLGGSPKLWQTVETCSGRWRTVRMLLQCCDAASLTAIALMVIELKFALGLLVLGWFFAFRQGLLEAIRLGFRGRILSTVSWSAAALLLIAGALLAGGPLVARARTAHEVLPDWENDPLFAALGRGEGLMLTAARIPLIQFQSRRGELLYRAALNQIAYVPASAPAVNEILREVYGDDLLEPRPDDWIRCGGLMPESARRLWAERTPEEWLALARRFGFTDVVAYPDWTLNLPRVAQNRRYAAYHIPGAESPAGVGPAHHSLVRLPSDSPSKSDSTTAEASLPKLGE
jgi:hypothetical protein